MTVERQRRKIMPQTRPLQTLRAGMQTQINQNSSQAGEAYFTLKEWPTLWNTEDH